jgi:hypothetical protein
MNNMYLRQVEILTRTIGDIQSNHGEDISPIHELVGTTPWICLPDGVAPKIRDQEERRRKALRQLAAAARSLATMIDEEIDREVARELEYVADLAANPPVPIDPTRDTE